MPVVKPCKLVKIFTNINEFDEYRRDKLPEISIDQSNIEQYKLQHVYAAQSHQRNKNLSRVLNLKLVATQSAALSKAIRGRLRKMSKALNFL